MNITYATREELLIRIQQGPFNRPIILLDEDGARRWGLIDYLQSPSMPGRWVSTFLPNPTQDSVFQVREEIGEFSADGLIAIGGGSTIDMAKAISALNTMGVGSSDQIKQAIVEKTYVDNAANALPIIAVPTTAGTGSEVTSWATIWDAQSSAKYSIDAHWIKPVQAWIVPDLLASLPAHLALTTGLDATSHATEAYWAKASNPLVKALSIRALQILVPHLKYGIHHLDDPATRETLATGSLLAGMAFSMTRTTACHALSYPMTSMHQVPHGLACAMTLGPVADLNSQVCDLSELLAVFAPYGGIQVWVDDVCDGIVVPRLSHFGITKHDIGTLAAQSQTPGRADNNPAQLSVDVAQDVLLSVL